MEAVEGSILAIKLMSVTNGLLGLCLRLSVTVRLLKSARRGLCQATKRAHVRMKERKKQLGDRSYLHHLYTYIHTYTHAPAYINTTHITP